MLQTPMLATIVAPATTTHDVLEPKATSLRRAATALFFFGMLCARPCPSSWGAWLAMFGSVAVLCASQKTILCRSRFARALSFFAAIFAAYSFVTFFLSIREVKPQQIADKFQAGCMDLPEETFAYVQHKVVEHKFLEKGLSFYYARHMSQDETTSAPPPALHIGSAENASSMPHPTMLVGAVEPKEPKDWTQPVACDTVAHFVQRAAQMMMIGSTLAHLLLFLSAVAVVKRACRLRCAAYRAGLLEWKCGARCKAKCQRAEPAPTDEPVVAAKEMA